MSDADDHAKRERRRRLIERLNEKEGELSGSRGGGGSQLSEEQLDAEIEKERQRNLSRQGFPIAALVADRVFSNRNAPQYGLRIRESAIHPST